MEQVQRLWLRFDLLIVLVRPAVCNRRDLALLVKVDDEPTGDVFVPDVFVPLWRVPHCLVWLDVVLLEEPAHRHGDAVIVPLERVDVRPVVVLLKRDDCDLVGVLVVREDDRLFSFEVLLGDGRVRCNLAVLPERDKLAPVENTEPLVSERVRDLIDEYLLLSSLIPNYL